MPEIHKYRTREATTVGPTLLGTRPNRLRLPKISMSQVCVSTDATGTAHANAMNPRAVGIRSRSTSASIKQDTIRVLVVAERFSPAFAGWIHQTVRLIKACDKENIEFVVLSRRIRGSGESEQLWRNARIQRVGLADDGKFRLRQLLFIVSASVYLLRNRRRIDVVYCPIAFFPSGAFIAWARIVRRPAVSRISGQEASQISGFRGWLRVQALRSATATIALNNRQADDLIGAGVSAQGIRGQVIVH